MLKTRSRQIQSSRLVQESSIQEVYRPSETDENGIITPYSGLIESLFLYVDINSMTTRPLPSGLDSMGTSQAREAFHEYMWSTERFDLALYAKRYLSSSWAPFATIPLNQRSGYYTIDLLGYFPGQVAYRVASGASIGYRVKSAGYGFPTDVDEIYIHGVAFEEADVALVGEEDLTTIRSQIFVLSGQIEQLSNSVAALSAKITSGGTVTPEPEPGPEPEPEPGPTTPNSGSFVVHNNAVVTHNNTVVTPQ